MGGGGVTALRKKWVSQKTENMNPANFAAATFRICTLLITSILVLASLGGSML